MSDGYKEMAMSREHWDAKRDAEIADLAARLAEGDALIAKGLAVVHDFLPNIGRCVLQDYQRMNEFCVEASKRAADSADECAKSGHVPLAVTEGVKCWRCGVMLTDSADVTPK